VAVPAVDAVIPDVMFVAELNGLFSRKICLCVVGGSVEFEQKPDDYCDEENRAEDANFRNKVGTSMKDLSHRFAKSRLELEKTLEAAGNCPLAAACVSPCADYGVFQTYTASRCRPSYTLLGFVFLVCPLLSSAGMRGVANAIDSTSVLDTSQRRLMF